MDAFSALGYHAVSMDAIAARVGISAAALYRHSPSKYDLFRDAVLDLGQQLVDSTEFTESSPADADPQRELEALVGALIETTIANRLAGGLCRWEARYLDPADQDDLGDRIKFVNRRVQRPLAVLRPNLTPHQRQTLSAAALSVIGSITDHRDALTDDDIREVLTRSVFAVLAAKLPRRPAGSAKSAALAVPAAAGTYEMLMYESIRLFHERGYWQTGMEEIAEAVGLPASGIYRYFPGKAEFLAASVRRAADRMSGDLADVLSRTPEPAKALRGLITAHIDRSFGRPELAYVYHTERKNIPDADAALLENIERCTVDAWAQLVVAVGAQDTVARARFPVRAAMTVVVDRSWLGRYVNADYSRTTARRLMEAILFNEPPGPFGRARPLARLNTLG
jgi:AcrR family transcriptional regulator